MNQQGGSTTLAPTMRAAEQMASTYLSNAGRGGSRQRAGTKDQASAQHDANSQRNNPNVLPLTTGRIAPGQTRMGRWRQWGRTGRSTVGGGV